VRPYVAKYSFPPKLRLRESFMLPWTCVYLIPYGTVPYRTIPYNTGTEPYGTVSYNYRGQLWRTIDPASKACACGSDFFFDHHFAPTLDSRNRGVFFRRTQGLVQVPVHAHFPSATSSIVRFATIEKRSTINEHRLGPCGQWGLLLVFVDFFGSF